MFVNNRFVKFKFEKPNYNLKLNHENIINVLFYSEKNIGKKVEEVVDELAALPPKAMKKGLNAFYKQEFKDFDEAMDFLEKQIAESLQSEEAQEGITAFLEKRPPNWK